VTSAAHAWPICKLPKGTPKINTEAPEWYLYDIDDAMFRVGVPYPEPRVARCERVSLYAGLTSRQAFDQQKRDQQAAREARLPPERQAAIKEMRSPVVINQTMFAALMRAGLVGAMA
jgi:hypothetical protein